MKTITIDAPAVRKPCSRLREGSFAERKIVLQVQSLRKSFGGHIVLDRVAANLREGEVVLLRGDNGSGKTTLLNILSGNLEPDAGSIHLQVNGAIERFEFPRRWWQNLNPFDHFTPERVAREGVGRSWQDVRLFPSLTLAENIAVGSPHQLGENPLHVLTRKRAMIQEELQNRKAAVDHLVRLGLTGRENSSADRLSLGQSKRVAIARAVHGGAKILFLDEPLAGLDQPGIQEVISLLSELAQQQSITLVIIEHIFNIPHILDLADTVWTLRNGRISVETPAAVRQELTRSTGFNAVAWFVSRLGQDFAISEEELPGGALLTRARKLSKTNSAPAIPLLEIKDLVVRRGQRLVVGQETSEGRIQGFSLMLHQGEIAVLQAPNGWGKTTLFEAALGLIPIERGEFLLQGKSISHLPVWERRRVGLAFYQSRRNTFGNLTAGEMVCLSRRNGASVDVNHAFRNTKVANLSGGEAQSVALTCHPEEAKVHFLDEPWSALDANHLAAMPLFSLGQISGNAIFIALPKSGNDQGLRQN